MTNSREKIKGEQNLRYNLTIWKKNYASGILNDISEKYYIGTVNGLTGKCES